MVTLVALAVFGVVAYRMTTPADRTRAAHTLVTWLRWVFLRETPARTAFRQALRQRTRFALATPVLVAVNVLVFAWMVRDPGPVALPETLIGWGGSFGPRTTNGEWWRLVTASFVHTGFLALAANMIGLMQAGLPARAPGRTAGAHRRLPGRRHVCDCREPARRSHWHHRRRLGRGLWRVWPPVGDLGQEQVSTLGADDSDRRHQGHGARRSHLRRVQRVRGRRVAGGRGVRSLRRRGRGYGAGAARR